MPQGKCELRRKSHDAQSLAPATTTILTMTTDIELTDFAQKKKQEEEEAIKDAGEGLETELRSLERRDASVAAWAWTSASVYVYSSQMHASEIPH